MTIKHKLEQTAKKNKEHLLQFKISKLQWRIMQLVARNWEISVSELVRRCIDLVFSQIKDKQLLARIHAMKQADFEKNNKLFLEEK